jgi:phosphoribosylanthranilate isomerase
MEPLNLATHRTRIKICGITRREDAVTAASAGADAIGFVFHQPSPRYVQPDNAASIARAMPPFVSLVGLFVDADAAIVGDIVERVGLSMLQFHGYETPGFCAQFSKPFMKAIRVRPEIDLLQYAALFSGASALLLDAYRPGIPGGTGETFDWELVPQDLEARIVLSGGLTAVNVGVGIRRLTPWAVDVSSGVESAPGIKDPDRIEQFVAAVRRADGLLQDAK